MKKSILVAACLATWAGVLVAEQNHQPYAGFQERDITSLSETDLEDLSTGAGWGLALPAELNGYPGPRHILELADQLDLTAAQKTQVEALFDDMQARAIKAGADFVAAEAALDDLFRTGAADDASLKSAIETAAAARADLRFVHLSQHLRTVEILSGDQVNRYNTLRGYGADDPCANVPEGHSATMWRLHNGCRD